MIKKKSFCFCFFFYCEPTVELIHFIFKVDGKKNRNFLLFICLSSTYFTLVLYDLPWERSLSVGKGVKPIKLKLKVSNLCPLLLAPKMSSESDLNV